MEAIAFSSVNPYESLQVIVADDPVALTLALTAIKTPIKIVAITSYGTKQAAYFLGDVRIKKQIKVKGKNDGNGNSSST